MAEPKNDSQKSEVWTNEEFEAFIDTELKKDPLHTDYPELFEKGALLCLYHSFMQLITCYADIQMTYNIIHHYHTASII